MATSFWSLPMTSGSRDIPVGVDEMGNTVFETVGGARYAVKTQAPQRESVVRNAWGALRDDPVGTIGNALSGAAQGAWNAFSAPGRAASGENVTMGDVADVAGMVSLPALAGKYDPAVANMGIRAYHGSPHDFDRFSMDKIGTGEGAQAYGHGLYFAEAEDVARQYRDRLSPGLPTDGIRAAGIPDADIRAIHQFTQSGVDPDIALRDWLGWIGKSETPELRESFMAAWRDRNPGHMYEVDINADPADFLDWDAPLSEQPNILAKIDAENVKYDDLVGAAARVNIDDLEKLKGLTGAQYYNAVGGGPSSKARELNRGQRSFPRKDGTWNTDPLGIPGIKYRDAGSRGIDGAEGVSRNYVVFDDSLIDIIRKYGWAAAAPLMAMNGSDQAQY